MNLEQKLWLSVSKFFNMQPNPFKIMPLTIKVNKKKTILTQNRISHET